MFSPIVAIFSVNNCPIVLSGSLSKFIEYEKLNKQANDQILTQPFILKEATFENNAGMLGVAMLFFSKM